MIVIGVDTHKRTHTLAAMNASTGTVCGERTIVASDAGSLEALRFVRGLDEQRVWAIEDCRHVSGRIERALVAAGERVIRIPPAMTATSRRVQRRAGKSDPIDATAVALAALREGARKARVERAAGLSSSACSSGSARFALAGQSGVKEFAKALDVLGVVDLKLLHDDGQRPPRPWTGAVSGCRLSDAGSGPAAAAQQPVAPRRASRAARERAVSARARGARSLRVSATTPSPRPPGGCGSCCRKPRASPPRCTRSTTRVLKRDPIFERLAPRGC